MADRGGIDRTVDDRLLFETSGDVQVVTTFDAMNLKENLLRGIYAYNVETTQDEILFEPSMNALTEAINTKKRSSKKDDSNVKKQQGKRGVVYLGRIPHGFFEHQMKNYFRQFGAVTRMKLSRNKKTGKSKHYAFIEFKDADVAKIVAETMHNYLMFGCLLQCKFIPDDEVHPDTFKGVDTRFKPFPSHRVHRQKHNRTRTPEEHAALVESLVKREQAKRQKLQTLGIDYDFDGYEALIKPKSKK